MKKIFFLILMTLASHVIWAQGQNKKPQPLKPVPNPTTFRLLRLSAFKKIAVQPFRIGSVQRIQTVGGSSSRSSTTIGKTLTRESSSRTGEARNEENGQYCTTS